MKKEINIKVKGTHRELETEGECEVIESTYPATFFQKDGSYYLFYEEVQDGFGSIKNKVIVSQNGIVKMSKKGVINSEMEFTLGEAYTCEYKTPFSTVEIHLNTEELKVDVDENKCSIGVTYLMDFNGQPHSRSTVEIEWI